MKRSLLLFGIPLIVFTYVSFVVFQKACDYAMSNHPEKPVPFTHKAHLADYGAECETCHGYFDDGRFKGIPTVSVCLNCHDAETPIKYKEREFKLSSFKATDKPWGSYARQPDLVYFSHKVVMTSTYEDGRAKANCGSCHGDKANSMDGKKIKGKMLMGQCEDCHDALKISNKCAVCHD